MRSYPHLHLGRVRQQGGAAAAVAQAPPEHLKETIILKYEFDMWTLNKFIL